MKDKLQFFKGLIPPPKYTENDICFPGDGDPSDPCYSNKCLGDDDNIDIDCDDCIYFRGEYNKKIYKKWIKSKEKDWDD